MTVQTLIKPNKEANVAVCVIGSKNHSSLLLWTFLLLVCRFHLHVYFQTRRKYLTVIRQSFCGPPAVALRTSCSKKPCNNMQQKAPGQIWTLGHRREDTVSAHGADFTISKSLSWHVTFFALQRQYYIFSDTSETSKYLVVFLLNC